jgi:hypothetical protein
MWIMASGKRVSSPFAKCWPIKNENVPKKYEQTVIIDSTQSRSRLTDDSFFSHRANQLCIHITTLIYKRDKLKVLKTLSSNWQEVKRGQSCDESRVDKKVGF